ncbi:MAG: glutamine--fructose-6-phosphate transaminase (isomerizing), partial [Angustibacter sp.]
MCGIVGYAGPENSTQALTVVFDGLRRLEYRGYDSAGIVLQTDRTLEVRKKSGKLSNLTDLLESDPMTPSNCGIGHTRWATHGRPSDANSHPHLGFDGRVAVVHNGILENFAALGGELLEKGIKLKSETDTEVAAHLLAIAVADCGDLTEGMRLVCQRLAGAFTLLAMHADFPGVVVGARRNSPLVVGRGGDAH